MNKIKNYFRQLRRLFDFIPIIWKGADWDYRYSIELFSYQLKRQADFLESPKAHIADAKQTASKIRTAVKLLKYVYEDEKYALEYQQQLEEEYGKDVLNWKFVPIESSKYVELKFDYEFWDNAEEVRKRKNELFKKSAQKQAKAARIVWKFIAHNIGGWWD